MQLLNFKKAKLFVVFVLGIGVTALFAQEAVPASGGNASGSGGSASYSVGQLVCSTHTGTNGSVAEGVQQPYEIMVITGIEHIGINLECTVYPNPTPGLLTLRIENYPNEKLFCQLFNINGTLLKNQKLTGNETTITMTNLVAGTYFLKVFDGQKEVKTFKIIKQ